MSEAEPEFEKLSKRILRRTLYGFGVFAPILIVTALTWWAYGIVDQLFAVPVDWTVSQVPFLPRWAGNFFAVGVVGAIFYFTGRVVETRIGKWFHHNFDTILAKLHPLYKAVKDSVKLLIDSIGTEGLVSRVVMIESDLFKGGNVFALLAADCEEALLNSKDDSIQLVVFAMHGPIGNTGFVGTAPISSITMFDEDDPDVHVSVADFMTKYNLRLGNGLYSRVKRALARKKANL